MVDQVRMMLSAYAAGCVPRPEAVGVADAMIQAVAAHDQCAPLAATRNTLHPNGTRL